jgi:small subunit ribosomal protein S16
MSVRIRLTRIGKKKEPHYRVIVADQRSPRDGKFIEIIGKYKPLDEPSLIEIDEDRALDWLRKGAQPSDSVANLLRKVGVWERFQTEKTGRTPATSSATPPSSTTSKTSRTTESSTTSPTEETTPSEVEEPASE